MLKKSGWLLFLLPCSFFVAALEAQPDPYEKQVAKQSDEWKRTVQRMRLPAGVKADLWAGEPLVANIVSFAFDEKGRCYVAETFRLHHGVSDNRSHMEWLNADLACRTVADRVAMYKKYLKGNFASYEKDSDRVRLVEDTTGSGRADKATVFADGFQSAASGLGSGVLARNGKVWYTCIPDLWLLQDTKGTGRADVKKSLHTGYGVHVSFLGHDMHGLRFGPDGKLYFSIGDRGLHVETDEKTIDAPDTGSVLRCNPDGSELELFATGLRNPQELAFDEFGNLFTGDNNADGGDAARWVHLVEGGDSGWRIGYQYLKGLGVWNEERLWHTQSTNTAAYLLPPVAHIANGPSGLTYNPGVSLLPDKFAKHFFLCDFRGSGGGSGIHTFTVKAKGASFELTNRQQFAWGVLATDCDFGPDGGFYVSDWVEGWNQPNKGRIYKLFDSDKLNDPTVKEVKTLLAKQGKSPPLEFVAALWHKDQRIRQQAQFALVEGKRVDLLKFALTRERLGQIGRLHVIWGLGQLKEFGEIESLYANDESEVRSQVLKVLARSDRKSTTELVVKGLHDKEPRVRFYAALAAGKRGDKEAFPAVIDMLKANKDLDPYLRHAGVMALVGIGDKDAIRKAATDPSASIRMAALLAMRRLHMPEVAEFLNDADGKIVLESARAIYDEPVAAGMAKLADKTKHTFKDMPAGVILRTLAANYRLGKKDNAEALVRMAARSDVPLPMRETALKMLQAWEKPSGRDWVVGLWRPLPERSGAEVADVLRPALAGLMTGPDAIRAEGAKLAAKHGMKEIGPTLRDLVGDKQRPAGVRIASLQALETLRNVQVQKVAKLAKLPKAPKDFDRERAAADVLADQLDQAAKTALGDDDPRLRLQGRRIVLEKVSKAEAVQELAKVIQQGHIVERQGALASLAKLHTPQADMVLDHWLDAMIAKKAPPEIYLDIILAVRDNKDSGINKKLAQYEATRDAKTPVSLYREAIVGGDPEAGRKIFFEKSEVSCLRCHKVNGVGGEVGPDLTGIGKKQQRAYLLESIVDPNKQIAKGYETVVLTLKSGVSKIGILKSEDAKEVRIMTAEGQLLSIPTIDIDERSRGPSAMPSDLIQKLSRTEVRDLVEFLAGLR